MDAMKYNDLRDFLTLLEQQGELKRITLPVDPQDRKSTRLNSSH